MPVSDLNEINDINTTTMYMYGFIGVVATILSITGLFTMLSLNIIRRAREIGIRKILGASVPHITWIINREFVIVMFIACALGAMASYNSTNLIMQSIWKYFQGVNALTYVVAISVLLLAALGTIILKVPTVAC